ncbi:MAG TPA: hypothetical protein VF168_12090 [Trueperaceae bacterium]
MRSRLFGFTTLFLLVFALQFGVAQRSVELSGIIESQDPLAEQTRVAVHIVDRNGVWGEEIATVTPVAGTFSITAEPVEDQELRSFRSGAVLLPGLQNEYRVSPDNVNYVQGRVNMYVDSNDSGSFERVTDAFYIGVSSLDDPVGFFSLIYVDKPATLTGTDVTLELEAGWNIFTVRFPGEGTPQYEIRQQVDDLVLTAVLP